MMQEEKIIEQLRNLKEVNPSRDFVARSKGILMSTPRKTSLWTISRFNVTMKESVGFALSVGLVAVFIIVMLDITPQTINPITGVNTPSSDNNALLNQANAAVNDINIHMQEVDTFNDAAQQSSEALNEINPSMLSAEKNQIKSPSANNTEQNEDIDTVLDELSNTPQ